MIDILTKFLTAKWNWFWGLNRENKTKQKSQDVEDLWKLTVKRSYQNKMDCLCIFRHLFQNFFVGHTSCDDQILRCQVTLFPGFFFFKHPRWCCYANSSDIFLGEVVIYENKNKIKNKTVWYVKAKLVSHVFSALHKNNTRQIFSTHGHHMSEHNASSSCNCYIEKQNHQTRKIIQKAICWGTWCGVLLSIAPWLSEPLSLLV